MSRSDGTQAGIFDIKEVVEPNFPVKKQAP
jgi:hypothetical protein